MKINSNHLRAFLRLVLRVGLRVIAPPPGADLVLGDFADVAALGDFADVAALGDFADVTAFGDTAFGDTAFGDTALGDFADVAVFVAAALAAQSWQINSSCSPSSRVV